MYEGRGIMMLMNVIVQPPRQMIVQAFYEMQKIPCLRKQPVFDLWPDGTWRLQWVCGTNQGIGSDNGYGVGHICNKKCALRIDIMAGTQKGLENEGLKNCK